MTDVEVEETAAWIAAGLLELQVDPTLEPRVVRLRGQLYIWLMRLEPVSPRHDH